MPKKSEFSVPAERHGTVVSAASPAGTSSVTAHSHPEDDALAREIFEAMHQLMHQYRARQYRILRDGPFDIGHMENRVLGFFARHPGASQSDLVQHTGRDKAQLARLVKALREKGLLRGETDAQDRRSTRLALTAAGEALHQALHSQGDRLAQEAVRTLTAQERKQCLAWLARIRAGLEAA